jgi:hypothetical protein
MKALILATLGAALAAADVRAQFCFGDRSDDFSITTNDGGNPLRVQTWSRTRLLHLLDHEGCAGIVGVRSELWSESGFTGCGEGYSFNPSPTATTSSTNHARVISRWCTVYQCGAYVAQGRHAYDLSHYGDTEGNWAPGGDCGGNTCSPCTPGYVVGECAPHLQDGCGCCPNPCPLVIDRSGDGLRISSAEEGALFDINGRRAMFWLGWPESPDDAWLAFDRNGNGTIDDGSELFGNTRRLVSGRNAENGYEVLAELDANHDGAVDALDPQFAGLLLWADANRNGVSESRELVPLSSAGIKRLTLDYRKSDKADGLGNRFLFVAVDGSSIDVFPVWRVPDSVAVDPQ